MADINLVGTELKKKGQKSDFSNQVRKITLTLAALFLVGILLAGSYLIILSRQIRISEENAETLKTSISKLENVEQALVLLRDRLKHIKSSSDEKSASTSIANFGVLYKNLPPTIRITEAKIQPEKTDFTFIAANSIDMISSISLLTGSEFYKRVDLKSFSFNPASGYLVSLILTN